ncbi:S-adenosylmethionine-binding protein [Mesorhizobium sp. B2-2-4]|uniref:MT-A70 family methyltransferase n=1 Tax=unclassified Mesorhizobium TaxID=325217 RepID=UPI001126D7A6|nr:MULTISPECIES: MT-A70 family methyltransferase [unclassified Mesorhizobium]TPM55326.1 S-adenosylmethionine-binding protein [Mesorhizobium sp. B2-2-4]TPM66293.1 S-adenosylmethionine-binding protein [Mesorhizobium sp. B2-2-1]TPN59926.1 S-adenosylmethionine-binding protein [Mesorhizobium sp. B1-1-3]
MKYQLLPRLSAEEYASLERSIIAHGVLVPVEYDEAGEIIDGHHRVEICESLGLVDWPRFVRKGLSEVEKRTLSREFNFARRHLSTAQKQEVIADQLRDTPSISSRAVAAMLGVDHKTVSGVRKRMVDGGEIPHHDEVEGKDGVRQPARKAIKTAFVPDRENVGEFLKGAKIIRAERQKVAHAVRVEHLGLIAKRGEATAPIWWKDGGEGPTYPIVYADPPWKFIVHSEVTGREKSAENHYPTMDLADILALGCPATKNAVLFLWVTDLANGLACMQAWGFVFKSYWAWEKQYPGEQHGTGYWGFDNCELLLIGTRGDFPAPLPGTQPRKLTAHPVSSHSAKPDWYAEQIERLYPGVPKLEMFCRSPRPGWDAWGFEAGEAAEQPISPLEGEMPGRAEGGASPPTFDVDPKLIETVAIGMQTETGRMALVKALDVMIAAEEAPKPKRGRPRKAVPA